MNFNCASFLWWGGHQWSRWTEVVKGDITIERKGLDGTIRAAAVGYLIRQRRECIQCHMVEIREVKT